MGLPNFDIAPKLEGIVDAGRSEEVTVAANTVAALANLYMAGSVVSKTVEHVTD